LRIPAEFNGICTIKPAKRYTNLGVASAGKFCDGVPVKTEVGPLTRTVEDLILWTDFLTNPTNYESIPSHLQDPYIHYKPFNHALLK
jgi:Asp-tRNA(Asn)/Glu-tRNA(Gln) amidotransferase A subunit family amidase